MKHLKKVVALLLGASMLLPIGMAAGCAKGIEDTENNLIIESFVGGYGTSYLTAVGERFEEIYEGTTVHVIESVSLLNPEVETKLKAGPKYNSTDMFFGGSVNWAQFVAKGEDMLNGYDCILEDLSDVYESPAYGETELIKDKMKTENYNYFTFKDGNQYAMPWGGGVNGLVYHSDVFENMGWTIPLTTNDLINKTIPEIKEDGWVPFTWPGTVGYWQYFYTVLWAQYEGFDGYQDFFYAKDANGNYTDLLFAQEGRLEALKVLGALIGDEDNSYEGSITFDHTKSQMLFLEKDTNKIAMMPNGDWLENEMEKNFPKGSVNIEMMKFPVISSIINELKDVKTEEKLKEVITAVDEVKTSVDGVCAEDFARVKEARNMVFSSSGFDHTILIPVYSNAKPLAKDFLRLLYSDWGLQTYLEETGSLLPFKGDFYKEDSVYSKLTTFQKSKFSLLENSTAVTRMYYYDPLFYLANLEPFSDYAPEAKIGAIGADKVPAETYFTDQYNYVHSRFAQYKEDAGIRE